jgi:hypothetical protein|tara:strand:- start:146 stop:982 length:837 start_codon:yes stop_codon:yes gene_type:complete
MYYVKKKDNVVKFDKTIEAVLALLLIYQSVLYLIISFEFVDPWVFPTSVLFLGSCGLGAVFGVFGGFRMVQRVLQGEAIRPQTALLLVLTVSLLSVVQGSFGFQNLNWKKGNDYSTSITDIPKFSLTKDERLRSTNTSPLWGFMDIPQAILKSDTDSIVLPMPGLVTNRIVIKTLNKMGWRVVRRFDETMDDVGFKKVYEIVGAMVGSPRRTDLLVRVVSLTGSSSVVDIRSSSPGRRRDLGFNELMIRNFADELSKAVLKDQMTMTSLGLPKDLELL